MIDWLFEHTEVITFLTILGMTLTIVGGIAVMLISGDTPEALDLQGAPETLGDFPPITEEEIQGFWEE